MSMPEQKPGKSRQDYETPPDFMEAFVRRFGPVDVDLAASAANAKAGLFIPEEHDSLKCNWDGYVGNLWLNPPFKKIAPWAKKCCQTLISHDRAIYLLVPASVGADWFHYWVEPFAYTIPLSPRLTFVGCKDPYPKDVMLCVYSNGLTGFKSWRWK